MFGLTMLILLAMVASTSGAQEAPNEVVEVSLKQGMIQGKLGVIGESRYFYSFRGIPYAQPPVGELRFKDPVPAQAWEGVRESTDPPYCPQIFINITMTEPGGVTGQENCLYLNVYSPQPQGSEKLPVMVFIHGGSLQHGTADNFGGTPERLLTKDIVLVSIQYRLGTLGFLSTGDAVLPGNLGLKDQNLALRWVKNNIGDLGGDPDKVTLFGESAGAFSVHFQMLTPYASGLFHRVILQSGTVINPISLRDDHAELALSIANDLGCPNVNLSELNSTLILSCLKEASVDELVNGAKPYAKIGGFPIYMVPRVDGDFIPDNPAKLLKGRKYQALDMMTGYCRNEAAGFIMQFMKTNLTEGTGLSEVFVNDQLPYFTGTDREENGGFLTRRALFHYLENFNVTAENADDLEKLLTEGFMIMTHDEVSLLHSRDANLGKRVYRYELEHRGQMSFAGSTKESFGQDWVAHSDDLLYLFDGVIGMPPITRPEDVFLSEIMVTLWTNFAKSGNPTPDLELGFKWEPMTSASDLRYLSLTPDPKMKEDHRYESSGNEPAVTTKAASSANITNREFWRNLPLKRNKILFPERFN